MGKWSNLFVVLFVLIFIILVNIFVDLDLWLRILSAVVFIVEIVSLFQQRKTTGK